MEIADSYAYTRLEDRQLALVKRLDQQLERTLNLAELLKEDIEKWKSHKLWSDKILQEYIELLGKHSLI